MTVPAGARWSGRLWAPLSAAAALRLALLAAALARTGTAVLASGDTASYLEPGRSLLFHSRFFTAALPEIDRTPGYPLFLAVASLPGAAAAALLQVVLSVFSVVLVWRLARAVFADDRVALMAAWLFALAPESIVYSVRLLPETLFLALLLLSQERLAVFLRDRRLHTLATAGVGLAAATFVRPVSYYLPLALVLGLLVAFWRVRGLSPQQRSSVAWGPGLPPQQRSSVAWGPGLPPQQRSSVAGGPGLRWKAPAVLLLSVVPWLAAWQARNWLETGFGGFSSIVDRNLYFYQAAEVTARATHQSLLDVQRDDGYSSEQAYLARHPGQRGWDQARRVAFMASEARRALLAHPLTTLKVQLEGAVVVAFTPCAADLLRLLGAYPEDAPQRVVDLGPLGSALRLARAHPWMAALMAVLELVLLAFYWLAVRGALTGRIRREVLGLLLGCSLYFLLVSGGAQAVGRYRLPAMPAVWILAAAGFGRNPTPGRQSGEPVQVGSRLDPRRP